MSDIEYTLLRSIASTIFNMILEGEKHFYSEIELHPTVLSLFAGPIRMDFQFRIYKGDSAIVVLPTLGRSGGKLRNDRETIKQDVSNPNCAGLLCKAILKCFENELTNITKNLVLTSEHVCYMASKSYETGIAKTS